MDVPKILNKCMQVFEDRGKSYGDPASNFARLAKMASIMLNREVTSYEVAIIMMAVKLSRIAEKSSDEDSYLDLINYTAFACQFKGDENESNNIRDDAHRHNDLASYLAGRNIG